MNSSAEQDLIMEAASRYENANVVQGFYLEDEDGEEDCMDLCEKCARAIVERDKAKGETTKMIPMSGSEHHDSMPTCDECGVDIEGWFTDYGAETMLSNFEEDGFDATKDEDCYFWSLCHNSFLEESEEMTRLKMLLALPELNEEERKAMNELPYNLAEILISEVDLEDKS